MYNRKRRTKKSCGIQDFFLEKRIVQKEYNRGNKSKINVQFDRWNH